MKKFRKYQKSFSLFTSLIFLLSLLSSDTLYAITGHNSMPEYRSFEPISTSNMVNHFTGNFVYNIPLLEILNGYPINLSYHSNEINMEAQASWVGLGWTLNPGAINRIKRGFPDEFNGKQKVVYYNKVPNNWTASFAVEAGVEILGDELSIGGLNANLGASIRYNNYKGIGRTLYANVGLPAGLVNLNFSYSAGKFGFNYEVNPAAILYMAYRCYQAEGLMTKYDDETDKQKKILNRMLSKPDYSVSLSYSQGPGQSMGISYQEGGGIPIGSYSHFTYTEQSFPILNHSYYGSGVKLSFEVGVNILPLPLDPEARLRGDFVTQKYFDTDTVNAIGYFYSENNNDRDVKNPQMDFFYENEAPFEKRDKILGIPFPNNDFFVLSGEAMGGSFRAYRSDFGHYLPKKSFSETVTGEAEADITLASGVSPVVLANSVFTMGGKKGGSYNKIEVRDWSEYLENIQDLKFKNISYFSKSNEKLVFRFTGDLVDPFNQTSSDKKLRANFSDDRLTIDLDNVNTILEDRNLKSTHISIKRIEDFLKKSNNIAYDVSEKNLWIKTQDDWENYNDSRSSYFNDDDGKGIGEITTYNRDGIKYVYGLPLYSRNEKQIQYGSKDNLTVSENGLMAAWNIGTEPERKIGYESRTAYATQFLLTQITNTDYIDRTFNGPSPDDFGSYTRFNYKRIGGGNQKWYIYRTPYDSLSYSYGSISDNDDDMGSVFAGEKELYYLDQIASKTHVAFFYTSDRKDGYSAKIDDIHDEDQLRLTNGNNATAPKLQKLDSIKLYSIKDCEYVKDNADEIIPSVYRPKDGTNPIKAVYFKYNYSLCRGIPNYHGRTDEVGGKLTLEKIWFEYNGKKTYKIAPYTFEYSYPNTEYPVPYQDFDSLGVNFASSTDFDPQNPNYSVLNSDRWGNYRDYSTMSSPDHLGDLARFFPYVYQNPDYSKFDPAAWCLKNIKLPSGGEIHIQYEQNDYQFVQDEKAMVMVPLSNETIEEEGSDTKKYFLDLEKIGINGEITPALLDEMFAPIMGEGGTNRLFFNFFYRLVGDKQPSYDTIQSDFIEGYARIEDYGKDEDGVYFKFKESPRCVCEEFYNSNRQGKLSGDVIALTTGISGETFLNRIIDIVEQSLEMPEPCRQIDPSMSYVRLQLPSNKSKKGGGVRVKRLLMYDEGIGLEVPSLYGQEYVYKTEIKLNSEETEGFSSGVAANEPTIGRRESPLVYPIYRKNEEETNRQKFLFGEDMYDNEAPLGASLLPSPSIGYSKVIVKNIHKGKTSTGFEVYEFETAKDHPVIVDTTNVMIKKDGTNTLGGAISVGGFGVSGLYHDLTYNCTQGFSFTTNDFHGKPKKIARYTYGSLNAIESEQYEYFDIKDSIKIIDENFIISKIPAGRESEIYSARKEVEDLTYGESISIDLSGPVFVTWPVPFPITIPVVIPTGVGFGVKYVRNTLRTHVTNKIVSYSAVPKRTIRTKDGITYKTENLVFDKYSGTPVITKTYDDFAQNLITQKIKASSKYPNFRSKSINEDLIARNAVLNTEGNRKYIEFSLSKEVPCGQAQYFIPGDFIEVVSESECSDNSASLFHVEEIDINKDRIYVSKSALTDCDVSGNISLIRIISSGYTNRLNEDIGNILIHSREDQYYSKLETVLGETNLFISDLNDFLNSGLDDEGEVLLQGPYDNMELEIGPCKINGSCIAGNGLQVRNLLLEYSLDDDEQLLSLTVKEFEARRMDEPDAEFIKLCDSIIEEESEMIETNINNNSGKIEGQKTDEERILVSSYVTNQSDIMDNSSIIPDSNKTKSDSFYFELADGKIFPEAHGLQIKPNTELHFRVAALNSSILKSLRNQGKLNIIGPYPSRSTVSLSGNEFHYNFIQPGMYKLEYFVDGKPCGDDKTSSKLVKWVCVGPSTLVLKLIPKSKILCLSEKNKISDFIKVVGITNRSTKDYRYLWKVRGPEIVSIDDSTKFDPVISIKTPGEYTFEFSVKNKCCSFSCTLAVHIEECIPRANINLRPPDCEHREVVLTARSINSFPIDEYIWDLGDGTIKSGETINHIYSDCESKLITLTVSNEYGSSKTTLNYPGNEIYDCYKVCNCSFEFPVFGIDVLTEDTLFTRVIGKFHIDKEYGEVFYKQVGCPGIHEFTCIHFCPTNPEVIPEFLDNVLSADATTYSDQWDYESIFYPIPDNPFQLNEYENGKRGIWRLVSNYKYREVFDENMKNYEKGKFTLKIFNWDDLSLNDYNKWVNTSQITKYSPDGHAIEDKNILNIYSTAKYGYNQTLPILVAQNAEDHSVIFESFENIYNINDNFYLEDGINTSAELINSTIAHTGIASVRLLDENTVIIGNLRLTDKILDEGIIIRTWVHSSRNQRTISDKIYMVYTVNGSDFNTLNSFNKVSDAGEWTLIETTIPGGELRDITTFIDEDLKLIQLGIVLQSGEYNFGDVFLDDIRVQPTNSEMVCYVYDNAQRLIAVLDDQHYALLYQYNSEGILIRKLKETIDGIKTISETQYNTKGELR